MRQIENRLDRPLHRAPFVAGNIQHSTPLLGLLARVAPSLNVMIAGAPIRVVVGLLVIALGLTALPAVIARYVPAALSLGAETAQAFR